MEVMPRGQSSRPRVAQSAVFVSPAIRQGESGFDALESPSRGVHRHGHFGGVAAMHKIRGGGIHLNTHKRKQITGDFKLAQNRRPHVDSPEIETSHELVNSIEDGKARAM
jgi:hypothetical protein